MRREKSDNSGAEVIEAPEGISVKEAGRRGGRATLENQGADFFKRIGAKGGKRTAELYRELLTEFGRKGGRPLRPHLNETPGGEHSETKEEAVGPSAPHPAKE